LRSSKAIISTLELSGMVAAIDDSSSKNRK